MKISFNAPVVLTYTLVACVVQLLTNTIAPHLTENFFTVRGVFDWASAPDYWRLFSHAIGHGGWDHLFGNFTFILLVGPILEEKYGSRNMVFMIVVTAVITGILNNVLFDTGLLGASGVVFMMILLSSLANMKSGTVPVTFILIALLFLGKEVYNAIIEDNGISEFAHIIGGICGMAFGFMIKPGASKSA